MVNPILKKFQPVTKTDVPLTIYPLRKLETLIWIAFDITGVLISP